MTITLIFIKYQYNKFDIISCGFKKTTKVKFPKHFKWFYTNKIQGQSYNSSLILEAFYYSFQSLNWYKLNLMVSSCSKKLFLLIFCELCAQWLLVLRENCFVVANCDKLNFLLSKKKFNRKVCKDDSDQILWFIQWKISNFLSHNTILFVMRLSMIRYIFNLKNSIEIELNWNSISLLLNIV